MSAVDSKIIHMGNPILRQPSRQLKQNEIASAWLHDIINDMIATMHQEGGIGLAAPQIGQLVQVVVVEIPKNCKRYVNTQPFERTIFINPHIEVLDETVQGCWESCLSTPGLRGVVYRPRKIRVNYLQTDGQPRQAVFDNFLATALQHEFDHLQGILFVDRLHNSRLLSTHENYLRFWRDKPIPPL